LNKIIDPRKCVWREHPANPMICPPGYWEWIIADPSLVMPDDSPDGCFHLFANSLQGVHHYLSEDGADWRRLATPIKPGLRPWVMKDDGVYYIFTENFNPFRGSFIEVRQSHDLRRWSDPTCVLSPQYSWEKSFLATNGNACVVKYEGQYRLYFSAALVWLKDCNFPEPKYIGVAQSASIFGPYEKHPEPIISPARDPFWRNLGAGSMKVMAPRGQLPWLAFNNGIYIDGDGHSRSEIRLLESDDGYDWREVHEKPLVAPEPEGWKKALVYAMDVKAHGDEYYMYFNARDGWMFGRERIGLAIGSFCG
jgi:Glycosyl hydrolases family 43